MVCVSSRRAVRARPALQLAMEFVGGVRSQGVLPARPAWLESPARIRPTGRPLRLYNSTADFDRAAPASCHAQRLSAPGRVDWTIAVFQFHTTRR